MTRKRPFLKRIGVALVALGGGVAAFGSAVAAPPLPAAASPAPVITLPVTEPGSWSGANLPAPIWQIAAVGTDVYVAADRLYRSSDRGLHLKVASEQHSVALWGRSETELYSAHGEFVSRSSDHGQSWQVAATYGSGTVISALWGTGTSEVYAAGLINGKVSVAYSSDAGKTFLLRNVDPKKGWVKAITGTSSKEVWVGGAYASGSRAFLFRSTDQGLHWKKVSLPTAKRASDLSEVNGICSSGSGKLFIATTYSVYMSADHGAHWKFSTSPGEKELLALACHGREVFVAGRGHTLLRSSDEGATWSANDVSALLPNAPNGTLQAIGIGPTGDVFVGGEGEYTPVTTGALFRRAGQ